MRRMRITKAVTLQLGIMMACVASGLPAQLPIGSPQSVHGCLRPDVEKTKALLATAMSEGGVAGEVKEVQREVQGCTAYTITFRSSVQIASHGPAGGTRRISGAGSITFGLAPDVSEPDYELTSGPGELTAPIYWSDAGITLGNDCIVTITALPYTAFDFWLGVKSGPEPRVSVQVSPAGSELHPTRTKCPRPTGGWTKEIPGVEMIFTPAWSALHGEGKRVAAGNQGPMAPGMDLEKMKEMAAAPPPATMDLKTLQAMADKLKDKPPTPENMGEIAKLMKQVVPDLDQQLEAARDNFMLEMPGDCVAAGALTRCTVSRTVTLPDGMGSTQTIIESTVITIAKASASAGVIRVKP